MMKHPAQILLLLSLLPFFFFSCVYTDKQVNSFQKRSIQLRTLDYMGDEAFAKLEISLPDFLDTLIAYQRASDCHCCDSKYYRFVDSKSCTNVEKGWVDTNPCEDKIQRITIGHQCADSLVVSINELFKDRKENYNKRKSNSKKKQFETLHKPLLFNEFIIRSSKRNRIKLKPVYSYNALCIYDNYYIYFLYEWTDDIDPLSLRAWKKIISSIDIEPFPQRKQDKL